MSKNKKFLAAATVLTIAVFAAGCGGESKEEKQANEQAAQAERQATEAKRQAKKEAEKVQAMSAEEKKQAQAAATAEANEKDAEAQASESATEAANAEAAAKAAAAKKSNSGGSGGGTASAGGNQNCGSGIEVNAVTSCAFAKNVVAAWKKNEGTSVSAYSPDTGKTYTMTCTGSQMLTTCAGGIGAKVTFTP
ncbi:MAG TPA: hypothetical protein VMF31_10865 [Solirubrobacterales bacterium]|nr:hypothetical protein [Solirubrobacterales bacterium]